MPRGISAPDFVLEELLPGPVTVISWTKSGADMPSGINPGRRLLGVRVPSACFARAVARQYGHALALTSANQSGDPSTLNVDEFLEIWDDCSLIFDGGEIPSSGLGTTIVNLSVPGKYSIQRREEETDINILTCGLNTVNCNRGDAHQATEEILLRYGLECL
jgi:tRNA A37 threonylcarbamoyladenosine synthetase subunit TsaC/SUA5/YrdC